MVYVVQDDFESSETRLCYAYITQNGHIYRDTNKLCKLGVMQKYPDGNEGNLHDLRESSSLQLQRYVSNKYLF